MRTIIAIVIMVLLWAAYVMAGSEAEVVKVERDEGNNIRVWTQYKVDGVEVKSRYPKIDGKHVFCSRYAIHNFAEMTDAEIKAYILDDIGSHTKVLIRNAFVEKANTDVLENHLSGIVGAKVSNTTATIKLDTDKDGAADVKWTVKSDGTHTSESITPEPIVP